MENYDNIPIVLRGREHRSRPMEPDDFTEPTPTTARKHTRPDRLTRPDGVNRSTFEERLATATKDDESRSSHERSRTTRMSRAEFKLDARRARMVEDRDRHERVVKREIRRTEDNVRVPKDRHRASEYETQVRRDSTTYFDSAAHDNRKAARNARDGREQELDSRVAKNSNRVPDYYDQARRDFNTHLMYNTALVERKAALDAREKDLQSREKEFTKKHDADSRKLRKLTVVQDLLKKSLDTERTELEARKKKFDTEAAGLETRKKEVEELATLLSETRTNIEIQKKAIEETLTRHHQAAAEFNLHQERFSKARIQFEEREKGGLQRDAGVEVERKRLSLLEIGLNNRGVLSREWEAKVKDRECGLRYQETSCGLRENLVGEADKAAKSQHEALMVREMELTDRERGLTERENEVEKRETCSLGEVVGCDGEDDVGDMGDESLNDEDDFVVVKEEDFDSDFDFCEDE